MSKMKEIMAILPAKVQMGLSKLPIDMERLQEIRLRTGSPVIIIYDNREMLLEGGFSVTKEDVRESMEYISQYSLYAFEEEMRQGFLTIPGGHRVGIAGRAVVKGERVTAIQHISSLNIRVAHQIQGCGDKVLTALCQGDKICSTLLISPPGCGKTTLLRDLIRLISDGTKQIRGRSVAVVDERSEIGACYLGVPQNNLGKRTDVLDCCPKAEGMMMMIRAMSPEVLAVDEIGSKSDMEALHYALNCGCRVLASIHGNSLKEVVAKPEFEKISTERWFEKYVVLDRVGGVGHVREIGVMG